MLAASRPEAHLLPSRAPMNSTERTVRAMVANTDPEVEVHGALQLVVEGRLDGADRLRREHDTRPR